jgi:hypothetical protein
MTQSLDSLIQDFISYQEQFRKLAMEKLKEFFLKFWEENPAIKAVTWNQYAPYFNDGDACVFSVNDPYFTNAEGKDLEDITSWGEYEGEKENIWSEYSFTCKYGEVIIPEGVDPVSTESLSSLLTSKVMEPVMEATFGSDNTVIATREGFQVNDFSGNHD